MASKTFGQKLIINKVNKYHLHAKKISTVARDHGLGIGTLLPVGITCVREASLEWKALILRPSPVSFFIIKKCK